MSVTGPIDKRTRDVVDLGALKRIVQEDIVDKLGHRHLNLDVDFLRGMNPTAENVVVACWRVLESRVRPGRLTRLRLHETENNYVEYEGK